MKTFLRFTNKDQRFWILEVGFCDLNLEFEIYDLGLLKSRRDEMIIEKPNSTNKKPEGVVYKKMQQPQIRK